MPDVGIVSNFIDTQDAKLTNTTDNKTYIQLLTSTLFLDNNVSKHQLTNDTIDNIYSLNMISLEGVMVLTRSEWADLVSIYNSKTQKIWSLAWKDATNVTITTSIVGEIKLLTPIDSGEGALTLSFRIEGIQTVAVA